MNADRFRKKQRPLTELEKLLVMDIKDRATSLAITLELAPHNREHALAMTKLEEAVMWAVKGVTG